MADQLPAEKKSLQGLSREATRREDDYMERPEYRPEMHVSDMLMSAITNANQLVSLSAQYAQNGMYFRGYLDGLQYALAVLGEVFSGKDGEHNAHSA